MICVSPSILSADFARLGEEIAAVKQAGAQMLHLDVMDGHFVPNLSFGIPVIASVRKATDLFLDAHLMISNPLAFVGPVAQAGADLITFHLETAERPEEVIAAIRQSKKQVGVAICPDTDVEKLLPLLPALDLALIMTVVPGFGGQRFREDMLPKIDAVRREIERLHKPDFLLQVDGGVNAETAAVCRAHGVNCLVAGSAIFGKPDYAAQIAAIRGVA